LSKNDYEQFKLDVEDIAKTVKQEHTDNMKYFLKKCIMGGLFFFIVWILMKLGVGDSDSKTVKK
jgi:hypothetical protein